MNKIDRIAKPKCLVENAKNWTNLFIEERKVKPNYWIWHKYENKECQHVLADILSEMTAFHCSYCGIRPIKQNIGGGSIDHFKPKSKFEDLAYEWTNLFIACPDCQKSKGSKFPETFEPIKFDDTNYDFDYWFDIEWKTGKIIANPDRTQGDLLIATGTINWLGINKVGMGKERNLELKKYNSSSLNNIREWSYPYFLERG